jgi:triacylglycerol lipase
MKRLGFCLGILLLGCSQDAASAIGTGNHPSSRPPFKGASVRAPESEPTPTQPQPPTSGDPGQPADTSGPPYPIVLMHGMFGFQRIQLLGLDYFNGIVADLAAHGEKQVFVSQAAMLASSAERAAMIAPYIDQILAETGKKKVNLIGHSQGGLDARYLVSSMGYGDRVASVTMVSAPNHGSKVADAILTGVPQIAYPLITPLLDLYGLVAGDPASEKDLRTSLQWLSEAYVDGTFNPANPDDARVKYFSWAGRSNLMPGGSECKPGMIADDDSKLDVVDPLFVATGGFLATDAAHSVNDGLVPVYSAKWGQFMGCVPADHLDEVGQLAETGPDALTGFDHLAYFREIVGNIRKNGM